MRVHLYAFIGIIGALFILPVSASATVQSFGAAGQLKNERSALVKVHTRKRVHDQLHNYGYNPVIFQRQFYGDYDKPVYVFYACKQHRAFRINVSWYGEILAKRSAGRCHRNDDYEDDDDEY